MHEVLADLSCQSVCGEEWPVFMPLWSADEILQQDWSSFPGVLAGSQGLSEDLVYLWMNYVSERANDLVLFSCLVHRSRRGPRG